MNELNKQPRCKVYISGPTPGHDLDSRQQSFRQLAYYFDKVCDLQVVNTFSSELPLEASNTKRLRENLRQLLSCDYIYLMHGWQCSAGCRLELRLAMNVSIHPIHVSLPYYKEYSELEEISLKQELAYFDSHPTTVEFQ